MGKSKFRGGFMKKQYKGGIAYKKGPWTVCRFKGGRAWQERGGLRGGGVDTPMHTVIT